MKRSNQMKLANPGLVLNIIENKLPALNLPAVNSGSVMSKKVFTEFPLYMPKSLIIYTRVDLAIHVVNMPKPVKTKNAILLNLIFESKRILS